MAGAEDAADRDRDQLVGTWQGFVVEGRGANPNDGPVKIEVVITRDRITARDLRADKSLGEGTYKLDSAKKLKEIDATGSVSGRRSRTFLGIYEIEGDTLKWCADNVGKGRPAEFLSQRGQYLLILKRQKP
jgi:uncharacterized protein (TIGR03067 family)